MNQAPVSNILLWSLRAALYWTHLPLIGVIFLPLVWLSTSQAISLADGKAGVDANLWDAFLLTYSGPSLWNPTILPMLVWLVPHLLFLYLVGDLAASELTESGAHLIHRVGSRLRWWLGKLLTLLLLTVGYTVLTFLIVLAGAALRLPLSGDGPALLDAGIVGAAPATFSGIQLFGWIFLLFGSTLFTLALLQISLSILWKNAFYGFGIISTIAILSWIAGNGNPELVRWLPGSQSMLARHTFFDPAVPDFSLGWSFLYNGLLVVIGLVLSIQLVRRVELRTPR